MDSLKIDLGLGQFHFHFSHYLWLCLVAHVYPNRRVMMRLTFTCPTSRQSLSHTNDMSLCVITKTDPLAQALRQTRAYTMPTP